MINAVVKLSSKLKQSFLGLETYHETCLDLQNKWHLIWLKSLEWQCRLEQELNKKRKVSVYIFYVFFFVFFSKTCTLFLR